MGAVGAPPLVPLLAPFSEQHIGAASCRSRLQSQWDTPNFDLPVELTLLGDEAENWQN